MPYKPRVFISHSAKEPDTQQLCEAIANHIDSTAFEVLWDSNLQTSQPWRSAIDEWIWRCDAAVLVLSESATNSRYAAYEAACAAALEEWGRTISAHRRSGVPA